MSHHPSRTIIVTGAASGIGAAVARQLAGPGISLLLHTRGATEASVARLSAVQTACEAQGARCACEHGDLQEPGSADRLVDAAHRRFGPVDQIVSNAGAALRAGIETLDSERLAHAFATMPIALADLLRAAAGDLKQSATGSVVAISSFVAHRFRADAPFAATAAAKAALEALIKSAAAELAPAGVTLNCVAPGYTRKDSGHSAIDPQAWVRAAQATPLGRLAEPDDIAAMAVFLLGPKARHITGQVIHVDGGLTL